MKRLLLISLLFCLTAADFKRQDVPFDVDQYANSYAPTANLDASRSEYVTLASGKVSAFTSRYGSVSFTQGTADNQPAYDTLINGRRCIRFESGDFLTSSVTIDGLFNANAKTVIGVVRRAAVDTRYKFLENVTGSYVEIEFPSNNTLAWYNNDGGGDTNVGQTLDPGLNIFVLQHDGTTLIARNNGRAATTTASGNTSAMVTATKLGDASTPFVGDLCQLITYDKVLPESVIRKITLGLQEKWGINRAFTQYIP